MSSAVSVSPGERFEIRNKQVYIDGKAIANPEKMQYNYFLQTDGRALPQEILDDLEINDRDVQLIYDQRTYQPTSETGTIEGYLALCGAFLPSPPMRRGIMVLSTTSPNGGD